MPFDDAEMNKRHGWFTKEEGQWLYDRVQEIMYQKSGGPIILEIGCWQGRSTNAMLQGLYFPSPTRKLMDKDLLGHLYSVDHFLGVPESGHNVAGGPYGSLLTSEGRASVLKSMLDNTEEYRRLGCHTLLEYPASEFYEHIAPYLFKHNPADLVFIDGDHEQKSVEEDIHYCLKFLRPGGLLCGHDYRTSGNEGVKYAVDKLLPDRNVAPNTSIWYYYKPLTGQ